MPRLYSSLLLALIGVQLSHLILIVSLVIMYRVQSVDLYIIINFILKQLVGSSKYNKIRSYLMIDYLYTTSLYAEVVI